VKKTILDILLDHAETQSEQDVYVFLNDNQNDEQRISYGNFTKTIKSMALDLMEHTQRGDRVVLSYPPGLEFLKAFYACLYAGLVAVPIFPPRPKRKHEHLARVVDDCEAALILTTASVLEEWQRQPPDVKHLEDGRCILSENLSCTREHIEQLPIVKQEDLAFLQYTSGSTGHPKGVQITHGNIIANLKSIAQNAGTCRTDVFVNWLPLFHDMGLIITVLLPVYLGTRSVLMAPMAFVQRPRVWLEAISKYKGSVCGAPNFAYELCRERINDDALAGLDLSSWRIAFSSAEPVLAHTVKGFTEQFAAAGFAPQALYPCYGMAEATVFLTGGNANEPPVMQPFLSVVDDEKNNSVDKHQVILVGCGSSAPDHDIRIVDTAKNCEVAPGAIGEIWAQGPSISSGYWGLEEQSQKTFGAHLQGYEGRWLRTGDLGCYKDGQLYITGRNKDLIVVNGQNYYPNDIESLVHTCHTALNKAGCAVFSVPGDATEKVVVVQELKRSALRNLDTISVFNAILQLFAENYALEVHGIALIMPSTLLKTSSGKVQRQACKQQYLSQQLRVIAEYPQRDSATAKNDVQELDLLHNNYIAPDTADEKTMAEIFCELLDIKQFGVHDDFMMRGLSSIKLTQAAGKISDKLGYNLPLGMLFEYPNIRELCCHLSLKGKNELLAMELAGNIPRVDRTQHLPLSLAQERLWFMRFIEKASSSYNESRCYWLPSNIDLRLLQHSFQEIVKRHEILRTRFDENDGLGEQVISDSQPDVEQIVINDLDELDHCLHEAHHRPFDLSKDSLIRIKIFHVEQQLLLSITMHHMITDGWSMGIFIRELDQLYQAARQGNQANLPELRVQYVDYTLWQRTWLETDLFNQQLGYWQQQLENIPAAHSLPLDYPRPARQTFNGQLHEHSLDGTLFENITTFCKQQQVTPFIFLQSVFALLIAQYSEQQDVVIGTAISGRVHNDLDGVMGFFVNTLALRSKVREGESFTSFLARNRAMIIAAFQHQHLPFPTLVKKINPKRSLNISPVTQIMFALHNRENVEFNLNGVNLRERSPDQVNAKTDLELNIYEERNTFRFSWIYNKDLFTEQRIVTMAQHLMAILPLVLLPGEQQIDELPRCFAVEH
jgi:acyl-CoA synthetase (AMP-forming)/AMP-acid ligase II